MAKSKTKKIEYTVETKKKVLTVTDGISDGIRIDVVIDTNHIQILPKGGDEFCFKSSNQDKTIARWRKVIDGLSMAVTVLEDERKL